MPTDVEISAGTTAAQDEYGSSLCAWIDGKTKRVCRINIGERCRCREIAIAVLEAAEQVRTRAKA